MTNLDYKALREQFGLVAVGKGNANNNRKFSPEVAKARRKEMSRRTGHAKARALAVLQRLHPEDYRALYLQAKGELDEECGPLPGDDE